MNKIGYVDKTVNPIGLVGGGHGCAKVSPGCDNCYAEAISRRFWKTPPFDGRERKYEWRTKQAEKVVYRKKPTRFFVCDMMDLWHHDVPDEMITSVVDGLWSGSTGHTFLYLTKRPERTLQMVRDGIIGFGPRQWMGVTVEDELRQRRIDSLRRIPAHVRWISFEPLLSAVTPNLDSIHWAVIGCESGPKRRECKIEWVESLVDQCVSAGVPVFVKQLEIDGKVTTDLSKFPEFARKRELPEG